MSTGPQSSGAVHGTRILICIPKSERERIINNNTVRNSIGHSHIFTFYYIAVYIV